MSIKQTFRSRSYDYDILDTGLAGKMVTRWVEILLLAAFLASCLAAPTEDTDDLYGFGSLEGIEDVEELLGEYTTEEVQNRIISGKKSKKGEWPWLIGIHKVYLNGVKCGGSILDSTTILTAAHCFDQSQRPSDFTVLVGETYLRSIPAKQRYRVISVRPHKGYRFRLGPDSPNDIAIMKLARPIKFNKGIQPIELPNGPKDAAEMESSCDAGGWGRTQAKDWVLQQFHVSLKIRPMEMCKKMYFNNRFENPHTQLCAGGHTFSNVCVGDSGGPLACKRRGKPILEGVVSFGYPFCGRQRRKYPTVFTRVASYLDWIKANRN